MLRTQRYLIQFRLSTRLLPFGESAVHKTQHASAALKTPSKWSPLQVTPEEFAGEWPGIFHFVGDRYYVKRNFPERCEGRGIRGSNGATRVYVRNGAGIRRHGVSWVTALL